LTRAFTLLEVMVAVAILGLSLTVILSAQAGLYSGGSYGQHTSLAIGLARCRMTEIEERLIKLGYPEVDENDDGACCEDDVQSNMRCAWKVERIELPQPKPPELAPAGSTGAPGPAGGPLGAIGQLSLNPGSIPTDGGLGGLASALGGGTGGTGTAGIEAFAMSLVYPALKPMLEASIRKVTVTVSWKEGIRSRDLVIAQYLTRPMRGTVPSFGGGDGGASSPFGAGVPGIPPAGGAGIPGIVPGGGK
jgi:general secretion pathway protein I